MRRVCHLVRTWLRGTETFIYEQVRQAASFRPAVVARDRTEEGAFPFEDLQVWADMPRPRRALDRLLARCLGCSPFFLGAVRRTAPALVHAHFGPAGWFALPITRRLGLPLITSFYSQDSSARPRDTLWAARYRTLFREGALFLALSEDMRADLIALGAPPEKVRIHRLGIDPTFFSFHPPAPHAPGAPFRIVFVGRFVEKKGIPDLVEAIAIVRRRHPHVTVELVGDGEEMSRVRDRARFLGLDDAVIFAGRVPYEALPRVYRRHHLFALASRTAADGDKDDVSMVMLEAMASGLPVLSTRHAGIAERFEDGVHCLLAREADPADLARQIARALDDPPLLPRLAARARERVLSEFDIKTQMAHLEGIYDEVVSAARPGAAPA